MQRVARKACWVFHATGDMSCGLWMSEHGVMHLWGEAQRARLVQLCAALTRDRHAAEDLAQETLLEAWRNREKLHDASGAERWLAAIARNVCLRWARRRGHELPVAAAD